MRRGAKQATPQLRVIGGQWRGRKLSSRIGQACDPLQIG